MPIVEYKGKTRRYFDGVLNQEINLKKLPQEIKVFGDTLKFPIESENGGLSFESWEACEKFIESIVPMESGENRLSKDLEVRNNKSLAITDDEWTLMKKYMVNPDRFKKEDFRIYEAWLAHNFVDRDEERFSIGVLRSFAKTIVGKSLLLNHSWGSTGKGIYYYAEIKPVTIGDVLEIVGAHPKPEFKKELEFVEKRDNGLFFMVCKYYMLASNQDMIEEIDSGIMSHMSIGFRAVKWEPVKDDQDNMLFGEYVNTKSREAEALEGSLVFLGSQYGARTRKSFFDDSGNGFICDTCNAVYSKQPEVCPGCGAKTFNSYHVEFQKTKSINNKQGELMKINLKFSLNEDLTKELEVTDEVTQEQINGFMQSLVDDVKTLLDGKSETEKVAEANQNIVDQLKKVFGDDFTVEQLKSIKEVNEELKKHKQLMIDQAAQEAIKYGTMLGVIGKENAEKRLELFKKQTLEEIELTRDEFKAAYEKEHPADSKLLDESNEEPKEKPNSNHNFISPA